MYIRSFNLMTMVTITNFPVERFYSVLDKLDQVVVESRAGNMTWEQLVQEPLSYAITHVGQLTLLRRMADSPVSYEKFIKADIRVGQLHPRMW